MSAELTSRSPDLRRLLEEGYGPRVVEGALVVGPVPFLDEDGLVQQGWVASPLTSSGTTAGPPGDHKAWFSGGTPHDAAGQPMKQTLLHSQKAMQMGGLTTSWMMSARPSTGKYANYYDKMAAYANAIASEARQVDSTATPRSHPAIPADEDSPLVYEDTASGKAGISLNILRSHKIGIVGVGGTGSYVLDGVGKTPVAEVHLWDPDVLYQHNAFRCPGAVSLAELEAKPNKAEYWAEKYGAVHRHIHAHPEAIDETNVDDLTKLDFVFITVDDPDARLLMATRLRDAGVPFVDSGIGMGATPTGDQLLGSVRTTLVTPQANDHLEKRLPSASDGEDDEYDINVQTGEANALAAALCLLRWKTHLALYYDDSGEHHSIYVVHGSHMIRKDGREEQSE